MELSLQTLIDTLAQWFGTTPAQVEQALFGMLVLGFIFASVHLVTMLITRWGDRNTNLKSLMFSLLVHLSLGTGVVVFAPEPVLSLIIPEKQPELIQTIEISSDEPISEQRQGNSPIWDQIKASEPIFARTEIEPRDLSPAQINERIPDDIDFSQLETQDLPMNLQEAINLPSTMSLAESNPTRQAAEASRIQDPFEYQNQSQPTPSVSITRREQTNSIAEETIQRAPQAGGVDRLGLDVNPAIKSLDAPISPDSELMRPPEMEMAAIERRMAPAPSPSDLPFAGSDVTPLPAGASANSPATQRITRTPTQSPTATTESPLVRDFNPTQRPQMLNSTERSPLASIQAPDLRNIPDIPTTSVPNFDAIEKNNAARVPATYRLRDLSNREKIAQQYGGTKASEEAVESALRWLASTQEPQGFWDGSKYGAGSVQFDADGVDRLRAGQNADAGLTALALLSFLGAGYTTEEGEYTDVVSKATNWLISQQSENGYLGGKATKYEAMYCHGMATYALAEAYGLRSPGSINEPLRIAVTKAVGYLSGFQNKTDGGWRYVPQQEGDMSMFGWQLMGLKSAEIAGIEIPEKTRSLMITFLKNRSRGDNQGLASYRLTDPITPAMTAEALFCKQMLSIRRDNPACTEAVQYLLKNLPKRSEPNLYFWYYGTLAMYQYGGEEWTQWNNNLRDQLIDMQSNSGEDAGSWDPKDTWGGYGGRIYSTTLATLSLEVYYRFLPLYRLEAENNTDNNK